jgi:hypothetical protein
MEGKKDEIKTKNKTKDTKEKEPIPEDTKVEKTYPKDGKKDI